MGKRFWSAEKIISTSAILISLMTLIVFIYQTRILRQQQQLSVLPYLSIGNEQMGSPVYKLVLNNNGIGPAFVESVRVLAEEESFDMDIPTFLYQEVTEMDSISNISYSNIYPGRMIPAGMRIELLEVNDSRADADKLFAILGSLAEKGFEFEIIYRSIYNQRWRLSSKSIEPEPLD